MFLLAILIPFANWKGAAAGMIVSHITILFVTFGHLSLTRIPTFLETSIEGCTNQSFSSDLEKPSSPMLLTFSTNKPIIIDNWNATTIEELNLMSDESLMNSIFSISYMYYAFFGTLITVVVGILVSLITISENDAYDSKYIHPVVYKAIQYVPGYGQLFSDERPVIQIKTSTLKESQEAQREQSQVNHAFDMRSEEMSEMVNDEKLFKSSIIYKPELYVKPTVESENYKKLEEV